MKKFILIQIILFIAGMAFILADLGHKPRETYILSIHPFITSDQ